MLQGTASFPGVNSIVDATISIGHGPSPSVATLTIAPQLNFIGEGGTLAFHFDGGTVAFPDCKIDYNSLQRNEQGEVWLLSIFDRRWKWKFGFISGFYNLREEDGSIKVGTEKTPHELAVLCFEAIKEGGYNLAGLPNDAKPEVQWDYDNPMEALAQLCDDLGCRIVLGLDNRVRICQVGVGATLSLEGVLENSLTIDLPERPDVIAVVTGPTRHQADFLLEAVGEDTDRKIKPIANLSYKPAAGWASEIPPFFDNVLTEKGERAHRLAQKTVYRWYRVVVPAVVPGYETVDSLDRLEFESVQVQTVTEDGRKRSRPAIIKGIWFEWKLGTDANVASTINPDDPDDEYPRSFSVDAAKGLVKFSQPIYANSSGTVPHIYVAATLRLRVACTVRRKNTLAWRRYLGHREIGGGFNTPTRIVRHDEIVLNLYPQYNANYGVIRMMDNLQAVKDESSYYLDGIEAEYNQTTPQSLVYAGLRAIELDGAIQQVVFNVGPMGATTMAARNTEIWHRTIPYKERRRIELQGRTPQELVTLKAQQRRIERQAKLGK